MQVTTPAAIPEARAAGVDVVVVSFDSISSLHAPGFERLIALKWEVVIIDEAHRLKERTSKRTKKMYGQRLNRQRAITEHANRVWLLSGTPARNHLGELYTHLRALAPETIINDYEGRPFTAIEYEDRFCVIKMGNFGRQIAGSKNAARLRQMIGDFLLRRHEQPGSLPPLTIDNYVLPASDIAPDDLKKIDDMLASVLRLDPDPVEALRLAGAHVSSERRMLGLLKTAPVAAWVNDFLDDNPGEKIVLFAHHIEVIETLKRLLSRHGQSVIMGSTPKKDRWDAIKAFQEDPGVRIFIGQTTAAGEAITLTAGRTVMLVEPSWVPAENFQALKRVHRTGQGLSVQVWFAVLGNTLDKTIMSALARKTKDLAGII
jgi:SWI/SNF-related matrix-associated actin-dependent regulator 1 of chromatin subfamily A